VFVVMVVVMVVGGASVFVGVVALGCVLLGG
jgi:hypothetical protein